MGRERYLAGCTCRLRTWSPHREGWDHDHCAFCQRHISVPAARDDVEAVDSSYVTDDGHHWVCEQCFADLRDQLSFEVAE